MKLDFIRLDVRRPNETRHDFLQSETADDNLLSNGVRILESRGCRPVSVPYALVERLYRSHLPAVRQTRWVIGRRLVTSGHRLSGLVGGDLTAQNICRSLTLSCR
jgi:hypothetical protein